MNWIISELFYPDEVSTAQIMTDIALHKVKTEPLSVICGPSGYENTFTSKKILDNKIKVYRVRLPHLNKNNLFQRLLRLLLLTIKMSWMILVKIKKTDTVLLTTNPTFLLISISIIKKIKGFYLEVLVHDVFPENLVPAGLISKDSFKYRLLSTIYNFSYRKVDRLIVLGKDMMELMQQKTAPKKSRIDIITNWHDDEINTLTNFNISEYLGIDLADKIVIGFAGNLGRVQGVLEFIDLVSCSINENIVFVLIGDGALRPYVEDKIQNLKLHNVYYLGPKGRNEQNFFLNACHIGLVSLVKGMKGLGVPSKSYNLMAAGKPLLYIGDEFSEIDNYIKDFNCGWSFSWVNEEAVINFLKNLKLESLPAINLKAANSKLLAERFNKETVLSLF